MADSVQIQSAEFLLYTTLDKAGVHNFELLLSVEPITYTPLEDSNLDTLSHLPFNIFYNSIPILLFFLICSCTYIILKPQTLQNILSISKKKSIRSYMAIWKVMKRPALCSYSATFHCFQ